MSGEIFKAWNHGKDIERIKRLIKENKQERIRKSFRKFKDEDLAELLSIAHAQLKAEKEFDKGNRLMVNQDDLRFTTPQAIGDYRAERIFRMVGKVKIADLCSGIGSQTISFAKKFKHVLSVDIDERKSAYALKNIKTYDLRNVSLLTGDIFSKEVINKVKEFRPKVIFVDPQRKENGPRLEEENLIQEIVDLYYPITPNLVIEAPPFLDVRALMKKFKGLNKGFEAEYLSMGFRLRRLTLYFSDLREYDFRVVELQENKQIGTNIEDYKTDDSELDETDTLQDYILEPSPALTRTSLLHLFAPEAKIIDKGHNTLLTSSSLIKKPEVKDFFQQYRILFFKKSSSYYDKEILSKLNELKAKYVVVKQSVVPKDYWNVRKYYEDKLIGEENKILYLFYLKNNLIIAELVTHLD